MSKDRSIGEQIAALRHAPIEELVAKYVELIGKPPRIRHNRIWLWKKVAWHLQAREYGGLSLAAQTRLDEIIAEIRPTLPFGTADGKVVATIGRPRKPWLPAVGTAITREWHGQQVTVTVLDKGFEYRGVTYRSLSAVAQAVTGSHWNGKLFFGLAERGAS